MEKTRINTTDCREILSLFDNKREALILVYLLAMADDDGMVNSSINTLASQLDMHRQTLVRYINRLCEKSYAAWENTAGSRQPNLLHVKTCVTTDVTEDVQVDVTEDVQADVTEDETASVTENVTTPVCCDSVTFRYESDKYDNVENPSVTIGVTGYVTSYLTANVTTFVTSKEEKKQKKEEFPPAPPIEEKKQKKERNNLTPAHACEKNPTEKLEIRRLRFIDSLHPYVERYGEEMIRHFGEYWTEENRSLTRMRFEMQPTWNTSKRLARWARNELSFQQSNTNQGRYNRPTMAEIIRDAQESAIRETEEFIRQAEIRRGGIPPHLPV